MFDSTGGAFEPTELNVKHHLGLHPHHSTTRSAEDPLLHRHRYQHHDEGTGELLYYQFEGKQHRHVFYAEGIAGVLGCEVAVEPNGKGPTAITLLLKDEVSAGNITAGAVIVGDGLDCTERASDGTRSTWQKPLRVLISNVSVAAAPAPSSTAIAVTFTTAPAQLHDVFEHAQIEFYRGSHRNLQTARSKRLESLAANGEAAPTRYGFATVRPSCLNSRPLHRM